MSIEKYVVSFNCRKMTARANKFSGFFASTSLNSSEQTNSKQNPVITFQDPTAQTYFK
jgi:hypothetical protein